MFEVSMNTVNNPFKPEIIDSTTIVLRQKEPFVQMSYKYDGDFSHLSKEEMIQKVLDDFYTTNFKDKLQEKEILELRADLVEQKETMQKVKDQLPTAQLRELQSSIDKIKKQNETHNEQNELVLQSIFELTEVLMSMSEEESEDGADDSNSNPDGDAN